MADKKISQLTGATTPLAGTEVLPIVQGGSTVKVSIANVTAGRSVATGPLTVTVGDNGGVSITQTSAGETGFLNFVDSDAGLAGRVKYDHSNNSLQLIGNALERVRIDSSGNVKNNSGNFILGTAAKGIDFPENSTLAGKSSTLLNWYEVGTWTPTATNITGTNTYEGTYTRIGNRVYFEIIILTSSTIGMTGASSELTLPIASVKDSTCAAANRSNGAGYGTGLIAGATAYPPTAAPSAAQTIVVSGSYQV